MKNVIYNIKYIYKTKGKGLHATILLSLLISFVVFGFVPPIFAEEGGIKTRMSEFLLEGGDIESRREKGEDGYGQVAYVFEGNKIQVTSSSTTKSEPVVSKGYIAWMAQIDGNWQIFLYNASVDKTMQLTRKGNNLNPQVSSNGKVVWESWVGDTSSGNWQLFLFDGGKIRQITEGDMSVNADIEGEYIVYARKNSQGLWRSEAYSILENESREIDIGNETEYPKLSGGDIYVGPPTESQKKYPLKVEDLFLLNLPEMKPSLSDQVLTKEGNEVLATQSADLNEAPAISPTAIPQQNVEVAP